MIKRFARRAWILTILACPGLVSAQTSLTPKPLVIDQYGEVTSVSIGGEEGLAYEIHLTNLNSYSVRIEEIQVLSAESLSALRVLDRDQFKLMPQSLVTQRIFGVQLAQELFPPVELPAQVGLHYFRLLRGESARLWERIKQEKAVALRWPGIESSDFDATLYMTVPDTEA